MRRLFGVFLAHAVLGSLACGRIGYDPRRAALDVGLGVTSDAVVDVAADTRADAAFDTSTFDAAPSDVLPLDAADERTDDASVSDVVSEPVALPPPRPVSPLSTARVTSHRPTLRWELDAPTTGARVELCRDRACTMRIETADVVGTSFRPTADLARGVVFWRLFGARGVEVSADGSPTWQFYVGAGNAAIDASWGATPDFDGDGFPDIAAGAIGDHVVHVFRGARVLSSSPSTTIRAPVGPDPLYFGFASTAGDTNGDGFVDLVVRSVGRGSIYLGGPSGLSTAPSTILPLGPSDEVAHAGDVNGDGYADLIVGAPSDAQPETDEGAAYVYFGSALGVNVTMRRLLDSPFGRPFGGFGVSVAGVGDVDGDGFSDVVVAAALQPVPTDAGAVFLYRGASDGPSAAPDAILAHPDMPMGSVLRVASAGDVNGDGLADLVIGVPSGGVAGSGRVLVYSGSSSGFSPAHVIANPLDAPDAQFGFSVSGAGDLDADGFGDLVIGAPQQANPEVREGVVFVFLGGRAKTSLSFRQITLDSPAGQTRCYFGDSAVGFGDGDLDGFDDLVIGAPFRADPELDEGAVYVYRGDVTGVPTTPSLAIDNPLDAPNGLFGRSHAAGGF